jgi:DMSO/TMAO reductase YedYZ molybdopterin-dependent catalytic subunit
MRRLTRRSFTVGTVAALAGLAGWHWLTAATPDDDLPWPLRLMLRANQGLGEGLFSRRRLAPTFPEDMVEAPARINGHIGLEDGIDLDDWEVRVEHPGRPDRLISLDAIQKLPRVDLVTELKCVEGWGQVVHLGGVRFLDFVARFGLATRSGRPLDPEGNAQDLYRYVYLTTPDDEYYVGLDIASALHPQTLLCDSMNWQPLTGEHGAPLRLYLAVKYGYKSLKRIARIRFQDERPADYWTQRGYDWYAGL